MFDTKVLDIRSFSDIHLMAIPLNLFAFIETRFWDYGDFSEHFISSNAGIFKTVKLIQTLILSTALLVFYAYLLRPYFDGKMSVESYIPHSEAWDAAILLSQYYSSLVTVLTVIGYDYVYIGTSVHLVLQLRLLKQRIQDSLGQRSERKCRLEMCEAIQHHQFLYSSDEDIDKKRRIHKSKINMEALLKDDILHVGLNLMIFIGELLERTSKKLILFRVFNCAIMVFLLVFAFANFTQAEIGLYVRNVQTMFFKYTLYIRYKVELRKIFVSIARFWNYLDFDEKVVRATTRTYNIVNAIQISAVITSLVAVLMYFLKPAFNQNDVFIIDAWVFVDSSIVDVTVLACQYYFFTIITAIVIGYDAIYLSLCAHIVLQVRLLKHKLKRLSECDSENAQSEIRYCIVHHQFLTKKSDVSYTIVMIVSLTFIYAQFGYYVIPADIVASEFAELSNSIYMSNWYDNGVDVQKLLLLMMAKSQHQEYFDGGGMIVINIYTYGSVTIIKYILFIYYKENILELLEERLKFWQPESFDNVTYKSVDKLFHFTKGVQKMIIVSIIFTVELYYLKPLFDSTNRYLFDTWAIYDSIILETIILASQYYFLCLVAPIVFGYDAIYFSFCLHLLVQLRLLKHRMRIMKVNEDITSLYECIRHHQLVSSIFERMRQIYGWMLLFHYLVTLISACSQLYGIMLGELNSSEILAACIYIFDMFAEFAYYTFPVEEVVFEFTDLANAIYMSLWVERGQAFKRTLLVVMAKTQNQRYLSGAGMITINANAFGSVGLIT
ncbi:hypothetical protein Trydic_g17482 [Trypoxylus dichotomus]